MKLNLFNSDTAKLKKMAGTEAEAFFNEIRKNISNISLEGKEEEFKEEVEKQFSYKMSENTPIIYQFEYDLDYESEPHDFKKIKATASVLVAPMCRVGIGSREIETDKVFMALMGDDWEEQFDKNYSRAHDIDDFLGKDYLFKDTYFGKKMLGKLPMYPEAVNEIEAKIEEFVENCGYTVLNIKTDANSIGGRHGGWRGSPAGNSYGRYAATIYVKIAPPRNGGED